MIHNIKIVKKEEVENGEVKETSYIVKYYANTSFQCMTTFTEEEWHLFIKELPSFLESEKKRMGEICTKE